MALPRAIIEWRKRHPRTLEEQAKPQPSLEELAERWNKLHNNIRAFIEKADEDESK